MIVGHMMRSSPTWAHGAPPPMPVAAAPRPASSRGGSRSSRHVHAGTAPGGGAGRWRVQVVAHAKRHKTLAGPDQPQPPPSGQQREVCVGIDLGTTNSAVAYVEGDRPRCIPNSDGARIMPSVVTFAPGGEVAVGRQARRWARANRLPPPGSSLVGAAQGQQAPCIQQHGCCQRCCYPGLHPGLHLTTLHLLRTHREAARHASTTYSSTKRLIGRRFDDPVVQEELPRLPFKVRRLAGKVQQQLLCCGGSSCLSRRRRADSLQTEGCTFQAQQWPLLSSRPELQL